MEFLRGVSQIFLESTGNKKLKTEFDCFADSVFVFPGRRSAKFFIKYLGEGFAKKYNRAMLSPRTCTISNLFADLSGLKEIDSIEASIILYQEYIALKESKIKEREKESDLETYDEFSRWADMVLSDFNDIDKYRIDYKALFANIKDLKDLEADWSFLSQAQLDAMRRFWGNFHKGNAQEPDTHGNNRLDIRREFTTVWEILPSLYERFRNRLLEENKATSGIIYSEVASMSEKEDFEDRLNEIIPADHYVFIGFNAPNKCEEALFSTIAKLGKADFYWDFASPLVRCKENKASLYIERLEGRYSSRFPEYRKLIKSEYEKCRCVNVIAVPGAVQQAAIAGKILEGIDKERMEGEEAFDTAIVLPDEKQLFPVMNNIPLSYNHINVSMGYPVGLTPLGNFMDLLGRLQLGSRAESYYYKDICNILEHDYIKGGCNGLISEMKSKISEKNLIFVKKKEMEAWLSNAPCNEEGELLKCIFCTAIDKWTDLAEWHKEVLKKLDAVSDKLTRNFIAQYYAAIERILSYKGIDDISHRTFYRLESQLTSKLTVPFEGEPLKGLQVVGPLEIRCLDFKNLIILDVNESVFPKTSVNNSLIPFNLRKGFGLPTYEQADAIAAYHFYRSIYRSQNVWLLYDTRTDGMKNGEVSRFVKQLKYHHNVKLNEFTTQNPIMGSKDNSEIKVEKTDAIMQKLNRFRSCNEEDKKYLSASSLKTYLSCPLKFYLNNVEDISEEQEVDEDIASNTFGNIYHNTMQAVYEPYIGKQVHEKNLDDMICSLKNADSPILKKIEKIFEKNNLGEIKGQNFIVFKVLLKYIELTLERDKDFAPFTYKYSEKKWKPRFNGVNLIAFIDRTDIVQGTQRISDYKTGSVEDIDKEDAKNLPFSLFPASGEEFKYKTWLQLYFYAMIMQLEGQLDKEANLAVYQVGRLGANGVHTLNVGKEDIENFKLKLSDTIESIFNHQVPFIQAPQGARICTWCPFKSICKR